MTLIIVHSDSNRFYQFLTFPREAGWGFCQDEDSLKAGRRVIFSITNVNGCTENTIMSQPVNGSLDRSLEVKGPLYLFQLAHPCHRSVVHTCSTTLRTQTQETIQVTKRYLTLAQELQILLQWPHSVQAFCCDGGADARYGLAISSALLSAVDKTCTSPLCLAYMIWRNLTWIQILDELSETQSAICAFSSFVCSLIVMQGLSGLCDI